jgi:hypothetical protein
MKTKFRRLKDGIKISNVIIPSQQIIFELLYDYGTANNKTKLTDDDIICYEQEYVKLFSGKSEDVDVNIYTHPSAWLNYIVDLENLGLIKEWYTTNNNDVEIREIRATQTGINLYNYLCASRNTNLNNCEVNSD